MNVPATKREPAPVVVFNQQLETRMEQFRAALPAHIPVERFKRVVLTAVQRNPELLECDRQSVFNSAMLAAQDGLLPDGREGAMVVRLVYQKGKTANWQPMIAGIRKKVRNSGEVATWDAQVVYANDDFDYALGDQPFIKHKPTLGERGAPIAAYSIAVLKSGEISREVMSIGEVHRIRDRSDAWKAHKAGKIKSTPWSTDEGEMIRKTVARRHSKVLPISTDLDDLIRRDDDLYDFKAPHEEQQEHKRPRLTAVLDQIAQREPEATEPPQDSEGDEAPANGPVVSQAGEQEGEADASGPHVEEGAGQQPASTPEIDRTHADYLLGYEGGIQGLRKGLTAAIKDSAMRLAHFEAGQAAGRAQAARDEAEG